MFGWKRRAVECDVLRGQAVRRANRAEEALAKARHVVNVTKADRDNWRSIAEARREELEAMTAQIDKLRERLRDQTQQTQITGDQITDRVHDVLTQKGVVPDGITLAEHPVEQNVATCLSRLIAERDAALESLHTIAERFGDVARLLEELRKEK